MRKIFIITFIVFIFKVSAAQDIENNHIGLTVAPCFNQIYRFSDSFHEDADFEGKYGILFGLKYSRVLTKNLIIETGLSYSEMIINIKPTLDLPQYRDYPSKEARNMLTIPLHLTIKNKEGYFLIMGPQFDLEVNKWTRLLVNDQSGIGFILGIGKYFRLSDNTFISIAPLFKAHALIPFSEVANHQRIFEYGIKIDLNYSLLY
jgi:hypothetical protein